MRSFWTQECPWDRNGLCQVPSLTDKVRVRESISQMKNGNALVPSPLLQKQPLEVFFNPIQNELFRGCSRMAGGQKGPPSLRCHTYPTMMKISSYTLPEEDPKNIWITWHTLEFCWHQHFFTRNQQILLYQEILI